MQGAAYHIVSPNRFGLSPFIDGIEHAQHLPSAHMGQGLALDGQVLPLIDGSTAASRSTVPVRLVDPVLPTASLQFRGQQQAVLHNSRLPVNTQFGWGCAPMQAY
jgi:hypothetical protein